MNDLPSRKHPRLKNYDYSQNGLYFVTVCVADTETVLSTVTGTGEKPVIELTETGKTVQKYILNANEKYGKVSVENYIILPNHIHILFRFDNGGMRASRPTEPVSLSTVVKAIKTMVTRETGKQIWQDSFYDEVIKDDAHFERVWQYIESNAQKWFETHNKQ